MSSEQNNQQPAENGRVYEWYYVFPPSWFSATVEELRRTERQVEGPHSEDAVVGVDFAPVFAPLRRDGGRLEEDTMPVIFQTNDVFIRLRGYMQVDPKVPFLLALSAGVAVSRVRRAARPLFQIPQLMLTVAHGAALFPEVWLAHVSALSRAVEQLAVLGDRAEEAINLTVPLPRDPKLQQLGIVTTEVTFECRVRAHERRFTVTFNHPDETYENEIVGGYCGLYLAALVETAVPGALMAVELAPQQALAVVPFVEGPATSETHHR